MIGGDNLPFVFIEEENVSARTPFGHPAHAHLARRRIHTWPPRASLMWPASQGKRAA